MSEHERHQVTEFQVLAAMTHPLRRRLFDILKVDGPSTASVLASRTDQAVANISHHLRVLADNKLIEEVPELARDRRERWWRLVTAKLRWAAADFEHEPAGAAVARAAESLNLAHHVDLVRRFAENDAEREVWREGAFSADAWLRVTPAELAEIGRQLVSVLERWSDREIPGDGQQREPAFVFAYGVPGQP